MLKIPSHLIGCHLGIVNDELCTLFQKIAADTNRRSLAGVVGIGLKSKTKNRQALPGHGAEQLLHHQPGNAVLLPGVQRNHALPVIRHLRQAEMPAEIHQIEDVLLETAATKPRPGIQEFRANPAIGADRSATSRTSAPLASQKAAIELIEPIR